METIILVNYKMEKDGEKVNQSGKKDWFMKVSSNIINFMEKELCITQMIVYIKENGIKINGKVKERLLIKMVLTIQAVFIKV